MNTSDYLQINLIPITALIIMWVNARETLAYTWRNHALRFLMTQIAGIMTVDVAAWALNGSPSAAARFGLWVLNTIYFGMLVWISFIWFLYVKDVVEDGMGQRGKDVILPALPLGVYLLFLIANLWNHQLFYIDEQNYFVRGDYFQVCMLMALGYLVAASVRALFWRKPVIRDEKREYRLLALFALLPTAAGIVQMRFYGMAVQWPFTAASLVMLYINVQKEQVTRDGLTGLNNRRRLDHYLESIEPWKEEKVDWYLLVLDVDRFKKINDTYGHVMGDKVLCQVAAQLKKIFGDTRAFLARYGGDEFVVIIKTRNPEEIQRRKKSIADGLARISWGDEEAWTIRASVGCAKYDKEAMHGIEEWFQAADQQMYEQKKREV